MVSNELFLINKHGEVFDTLLPTERYVKLNAGDKILRGKTIEYLESSVAINYPFVKINSQIFNKFESKYKIIFKLLNYLGYMDGILSYDNGVNIKLKDIPKICNISPSTAYRQIKGLIEMDVLHKVKEKNKPTYFVFNPFVAYKGKKISKILFDEFKNSPYRV